jgi:tetratricopeptide (TPR) repeat protein
MDNNPPGDVIGKILKKVVILSTSNQFEEAEKVLRDGLDHYPRSYELMIQLATVLRNIYKGEVEKDETILRESIAKCNIVLEECSDDELRYKARRGLAISYCMFGEQEKAIEIAKSIPMTDDIMIYILTGDERIKRCQQNIFTGIETITSRIIHLSDLRSINKNYKHHYYTDRSKVNP